MGYIKSIVPLKGHRLFIELESDSTMVVDLSVKLHTMKYKDLEDEKAFFDVKHDDNFVIWGHGRVKATIQELMEVALYGKDIGSL